MEIIKVISASLLSVVSLFLIAKIMGHKQMSQLDFFDYKSAKEIYLGICDKNNKLTLFPVN